MTASTRLAYMDAFRNWQETDPVIAELDVREDLAVVKKFGRTDLERIEDAEAASVVGSLPFRAAAAEGQVGVAFGHGQYFRRSYYSAEEGCLHGAVFFQDAAGSGRGTVSSGAVAATLDELLADASFCFDCGGFTASLTVEHTFKQSTGEDIEIPLLTTLRYIGHIERVETSAKGSVKAHVFVSLLSAGGDKVLVRGSALFVRPAGVLAPSAIAEQNADQEESWKAIVTAATRGNAQAQQSAERRRTAAQESLRAASPPGVILTHMPNFDECHQRWMAEDVFVRSFPQGGALDAPELRGKVLTFFAGESPASTVGAVRFAFSSQGPPSTAHGGSRFAVLQHVARLSCCHELRRQGLDLPDTVRLERCQLQYKARAPLGETLRVEVAVTERRRVAFPGSRAGAWRVSISGCLTDVAGKTLYDTMEATAIVEVCTVAVAAEDIDMHHLPARGDMTVIAVSSKL